MNFFILKNSSWTKFMCKNELFSGTKNDIFQSSETKNEFYTKFIDEK